MSEKGMWVFNVLLLSMHMDCYTEKFSVDTKDAHWMWNRLQYLFIV